MKQLSHANQPQHSRDRVCVLMHGGATQAAATLVAVAKLFTTKISRNWAPGGLLREEVL